MVYENAMLKCFGQVWPNESVAKIFIDHGFQISLSQFFCKGFQLQQKFELDPATTSLHICT